MKKINCLLLGLCLTTQVFSSTLSGTSGSSAPPLSNATAIVDFENQPNATFSSLTSNGVTFTGIGGSLRTDAQYAGLYNARGSRYLDNNQGSTGTVRFDFDTLVNGFAFNWGASDVAWTLSAFDAMGNVIESYVLPITNASNAGDYVGLQDNGISYATMTGGAGDWIFVDNFTIAQAGTSVPEPAPLALLGLGVVGLLASRRKASK